MKTKLLVIQILLGLNLNVFAALALTWELEVFFPDGKRETFRVGDKEYEVKLKNSSWSCRVTKVFKHDEGENTRSILCKKKENIKDGFAVTVSCIDPSGVSLFEPTGVPNHQLTLFCKKQLPKRRNYFKSPSFSSVALIHWASVFSISC